MTDRGGAAKIRGRFARGKYPNKYKTGSVSMPSSKEELISEYLNYDPDKGVVIWSKDRGQKVKAGTVAGSVDKRTGYRTIQIGGYKIRASHVAWFFMTGKLPTKIIDHKNRKRDDDRWKNLREATASQNSFNRSIGRNNTTGFKGVSFDKRLNKYRAYIKKNGKKRCLGSFDTAEEASDVYNIAAEEAAREFSLTW